MIDGIKATTSIHDISSWQKSTGIELLTAINVDSGEQVRSRRRMYEDGSESFKYWTNYSSYNLELIETKRAGKSIWRLNLRGSLHKGGMHGNNDDRFTWGLLQLELCKLESDLAFPLSDLIVQNLEIPVNLKWDQPVLPFIKDALLMHRRLPFDSIKSDTGFQIGIKTGGTQHQIKVYDKALQLGKTDPIMRIEDHVNRMQCIKKHGIETLADLQNGSKVKPLIDFLSDSWDGVLMFDPGIISQAKGNDKTRLKEYSNVKFWINAAADKRQPKKYRYHSKVLSDLKEKYGDNAQKRIAVQIKNEWEQCLK